MNFLTLTNSSLIHHVKALAAPTPLEVELTDRLEAACEELSTLCEEMRTAKAPH